MFWISNNKLPITKEDKEWLEDSFLWFEEKLGKHFLRNQPVVLPTKEYFDWNFKYDESDAHFVLDRVTDIMGVDKSRITLNFYSEPKPIELTEGIFTVQGNYQSTAGKYIEYNTGAIEIRVERMQLNNPVSLIATIAHEVAHAKLMGQKMIDKNDEYLTEMAVLVYGFGIFNANSSIVKMNTWSGSTHAGWKLSGGAGYFHYKVHGFALALYANYRNEVAPDWSQHLERDVLKSFNKSNRYIQKHLDAIRFKSE